MGDDSLQVPETVLIKRAAGGDTGAFDELVTLHREKIYMLAYHMVQNQEDALDVTQETFIRAWRSMAGFDGRASLATWLNRIASNACIDLCRRRQRRPDVELSPGAMPIAAGSQTTPFQAATPGDDMDKAELRRRIQVAMASLSPEHRAVFVLKEIEDLSYEEIAKSIGCSVGTVMSRLFYARKNLQAKLKDLYEQF